MKITSDPPPVQSLPALDKSSGVGKEIKVLRRAHGLTQTELAARAGMKRASITNIESGRTGLTVATINAIAHALGYEVHVKFVREQPVADGQ